MRCSTSASSPVASTASIAAPARPGRRAGRSTTDDPPRLGLTEKPLLESALSSASKGSRAALHSACWTRRPGATAMPASRSTRRAACLSMHSAEAATPEPVCAQPEADSRPWIVPSSPSPPCSARK
jgi:hypothetical protein